MTTRRNVLTILGLASLTTPALATDDVVRTMPASPLRLGGTYNPERMAAAFERLAAEIRKGCDGLKTGDGVNVARFNISSELLRDDWLTQTLTIDLEIYHPEEKTS